MPLPPTILERAYELARSGRHSNVDTIRRQLIAEDYEAVNAHISGSVLRALQKLIREGRLAAPASKDDAGRFVRT